MFIFYDSEAGQVVVKRLEMIKVPEFNALYTEYGWNALQYLLWFSASASPYADTYKDEFIRHNKVVAAIKSIPWDSGQKKLPDRFYEDPIYVKAHNIFRREFENDIEIHEESTMRFMRRNIVDQMSQISSLENEDKDLNDFCLNCRAIMLATIETISLEAKVTKEDKKTEIVNRLAAQLNQYYIKQFTGLRPTQMTQINKLLTSLSQLTKHHETIRSSTKLKVLQEEPSVTFGDNLDEEDTDD